jgi:hypothetical protein
VAAAAVISAVIGLSIGEATTHSTTDVLPATPTSSIGAGSGAGSGASNTRSGPAAGGASGTVDSVSPSSFTMTTSAGQQVTVNETPSTTYQDGTNLTLPDAVTAGQRVLALGTTDGTTIAATQVIVAPTGSATPSAVIPFQQGAPTASQQAGQIPASYSEGSGTIVSGAAANTATQAALTAYPGGIVDRVVQLSDGEYEVHNIGVNWPHHVFVDQNFNVVGAN